MKINYRRYNDPRKNPCLTRSHASGGIRAGESVEKGGAREMIDWIVTTPYVVLLVGLLVWGFRQPKKGSGWGIR